MLGDSREPDVRWAQWAAHPETPAAARQFVTDALDQWGLRAIAAATVLVASELVTNAVTHAQSRLALTLLRMPDGVLLLVNDHSPAPARLVPPAGMSSSGRGLHLVDSLARRWGTTRAGDQGKAVWAFVAAESGGLRAVPEDVRGVERPQPFRLPPADP